MSGIPDNHPKGWGLVQFVRQPCISFTLAFRRTGVRQVLHLSEVVRQLDKFLCPHPWYTNRLRDGWSQAELYACESE